MTTKAATVTPTKPAADALQGCGAKNPAPYPYGHETCRDDATTYWGARTPPRACIVDGGHIHSFTQASARYCSARCRMKAMRARRAAPRPTA